MTDAKNVTEGIEVPIIMYHSVLKEAAYNEQYIVSEKNLEEDLKYLNENGYETVFMQDLINYVYDGERLCEKPIVLTFDDGFYNNYSYVLPLLEKYDYKAVISIVGQYTDTASECDDKNPRYAYLDWEDCRELIDTGRIELQNHSYSFHNLKGERKGSKQVSGESGEHYGEVFKNDIGNLQEKMLSELKIAPTTYTYPFGLISNTSIPLVKELGFKASLSCAEGVSKITSDPECLYLLKRCIRTNNRSVEKILLDNMEK